MNKRSFLLILFFLTINLSVKSQTQDPILPGSPVEARHRVRNVGLFLMENTRYDLDALKKGIKGDVVLSFAITREGRAENISVSGSTSNLLSTTSLVAFEALENDWIPATLNHEPMDKEYKIVFRYRFYIDSQPADYKGKALKFEEKEKFSKALQLYDKAIAENIYDAELFEGRSKVKEHLGDIEGARLDKEAAIELDGEIMAVVDVTAIRQSRVRTEIRPY